MSTNEHPPVQVDLDELERIASAATPGPWTLWTGCSWRRFGSEHTGRSVCEPTNHPMDGHPDLHFNNAPDGRHIAAAHPSAVLSLIQRIRDLEDRVSGYEHSQSIDRLYEGGTQ